MPIHVILGQISLVVKAGLCLWMCVFMCDRANKPPSEGKHTPSQSETLPEVRTMKHCALRNTFFYRTCKDQHCQQQHTFARHIFNKWFSYFKIEFWHYPYSYYHWGTSGSFHSVRKVPKLNGLFNCNLCLYFHVFLPTHLHQTFTYMDLQKLWLSIG